MTDALCTCSAVCLAYLGQQVNIWSYLGQQNHTRKRLPCSTFINLSHSATSDNFRNHKKSPTANHNSYLWIILAYL